jgi:NAD+ kinase
VIGDEATVAVSLRTSDVEVHVTLDGQEGFPLAPEDTVVITRSPRTLRLVRAPRDYFEVLRTKLKWGEARRQREDS